MTSDGGDYTRPRAITTTARRRRRGRRLRREQRRDRASGRAPPARAAWRIEGGRLAVARPRQIDRDLVEHPPRTRPHHHHAVGQHDRLVDVVGDHDQRRAARSAHRSSRWSCRSTRVKASSAENGSSSSSTSGRATSARAMRDALRLAAGQFARPAPRLLGQADALERVGDARVALRLRPVGEPEADIVGDREPRQQPRLLEHDADLLVRRRDRRRRRACTVPWRRPVEAGDERAAASTCRSRSRRPRRRSRRRRRRARRRRARARRSDRSCRHALEREHRRRSPARREGVLPAQERRRGDGEQPSVSLPSTAKARIAATICAGLPSCWPSISR